MRKSGAETCEVGTVACADSPRRPRGVRRGELTPTPPRTRAQWGSRERGETPRQAGGGRAAPRPVSAAQRDAGLRGGLSPAAGGKRRATHVRNRQM